MTQRNFLCRAYLKQLPPAPLAEQAANPVLDTLPRMIVDEFVCVARLADYQFGITRHSRLRDCGTANVFPVPGKEVWGVVYDVGDSELLILDSFEDGYWRTVMPVYAIGDGAQPLASLIYIAEIESNVPPPNAEYKRLILEGAKYWQLPSAYIATLESLQAAVDH